MREIIKWIKDVRKECKRIIKIDLEKIMKEMKKGNWDNKIFHSLLTEIRDNERDEALLSLIEEMILEEIKSKKEVKK